MKRKRIYIYVILIIINTTSIAHAWDGERKGFILGVGLGQGFVSHTQNANGYKSIDDSNIALSGNFKMGYAPNNCLMIYTFGTVTFFKNNYILDDKKWKISSKISEGLGISYYFNETAPSPYIMGGIGESEWDAEKEEFEPDIENSVCVQGYGIAVGGGYEFNRYFSVEGHVTWGNTSKEISETGYKAKFFSINITLNVVGY